MVEPVLVQPDRHFIGKGFFVLIILQKIDGLVVIGDLFRTQDLVGKGTKLLFAEAVGCFLVIEVLFKLL